MNSQTCTAKSRSACKIKERKKRKCQLSRSQRGGRTEGPATRALQAPAAVAGSSCTGRISTDELQTGSTMTHQESVTACCDRAQISAAAAHQRVSPLQCTQCMEAPQGGLAQQVVVLEPHLKGWIEQRAGSQQRMGAHCTMWGCRERRRMSISFRKEACRRASCSPFSALMAMGSTSCR